MPEDAARETDDRGLREEGQRRVGERKVSVGDVAEGDAVRVLQDVARVPEDSEARVLPDDHGGARGEEQEGGGPVVPRPALLFGRLRGRFARVHVSALRLPFALKLDL